MEGMRVLAILGAAVAAVVLFFLLRPGGEDEPDATPTPTTQPATSTARTARTRPPTRATPTATTVRIAVRGGRVVGGIRRLRVARGTRVTLVVGADVTDHVHLHGYDVMRDVAPGAPARLTFRATTPGRFEVELEDAGRQIAEIEVRP